MISNFYNTLTGKQNCSIALLLTIFFDLQNVNQTLYYFHFIFHRKEAQHVKVGVPLCTRIYQEWLIHRYEFFSILFIQSLLIHLFALLYQTHGSLWYDLAQNYNWCQIIDFIDHWFRSDSNLWSLIAAALMIRASLHSFSRERVKKFMSFADKQ